MNFFNKLKNKISKYWCYHVLMIHGINPEKLTVFFFLINYKINKGNDFQTLFSFFLFINMHSTFFGFWEKLHIKIALKDNYYSAFMEKGGMKIISQERITQH